MLASSTAELQALRVPNPRTHHRPGRAAKGETPFPSPSRFANSSRALLAMCDVVSLDGKTLSLSLCVCKVAVRATNTIPFTKTQKRKVLHSLSAKRPKRRSESHLHLTRSL